MKKVLFIDRDGTLIQEPEDEQIDSFEKLDFLPGVLTELRAIQEQTDFELVMVTNQDGLGTASFPEDTFWPVHKLMLRVLESEGIQFDAIHIDTHFPADKHPNRKPGTGMLTDYLTGDYDLSNSFVLGDRVSDCELANNLGCRCFLFGEHPTMPAQAISVQTWKEIRQFLLQQPGRGRV